jgi:hypothetical protein
VAGWSLPLAVFGVRLTYLRDLGVFLLGLVVMAVGLWLGLDAMVPWSAALGVGLVGVALVGVPPLLRPLLLRRAMRRLASQLGGVWSETRDGGRWGLDLGRAWDPSEIRRFHLERIDGFRFVSREAAVEVARYWKMSKKGGSTSVQQASDLVIRMQAACGISAQVLPRGIVGRALVLEEGVEARATGGPLDSSFLTLTPYPDLIGAYLDEHMNEPLQRVWTEVRLTMPWQIAARVLFFKGGIALLLQGISAGQIRPEAIRRLLSVLAPVADRLEAR